MHVLGTFNENGDMVNDQLWFCLRKKQRFASDKKKFNEKSKRGILTKNNMDVSKS